jgi:transposase
MHHLSDSTIQSVILLLNQGTSTCTISLRLGVSLGAISKMCREHCHDVSVAVGGRPSKLTPAAEHHLVRLTTHGGSATAAAAARELATTLRGPIHHTTAARALKRAGLDDVTK